MVVERKEEVFKVELRPTSTFVAGLPYGMVHKTNQNSFYLSRRQNKGYTALIGQFTLRFSK